MYEEAIFLYHRTYRQYITQIRQVGLQLRDSQNPTEQLIEYYRVHFAPEKPSRNNSVFCVSSIETFFRTDMSWFGKEDIILVFKFDEEDLAPYELYTYSHYTLMQIWNRIEHTVRDMHPEVMFPNQALLTEAELRYFTESDWQELRKLQSVLKEFWNQVGKWNYKPNDFMAICSKTAIPADFLWYIIEITH
jgi:hypothetical protein